MNSDTLQHMIYGLLLSLVAGVPLLLLPGCCLAPLRSISFRLLPWAAAPALLTGLLLDPGIEVQAPWFFMGGTMALDGTGRIFLAMTSVVWLFSALATIEKFRQDPHRYRFAGYFLASMSGNFGLILARDILGFYLFFALMSFSAYGLIVHRRTVEAIKAGRVYLMLVFLSELAMFTALVILSSRGGAPAIGAVPGQAYSLLLVILLFIAFGVKVGALPFQSWIFLSYQEIPIPAATALAGAMVNAGLIGWLRFFPFGGTVMPFGAVFFIIFGAAAALYGVVYGLYQEKVGRVLASSSMSQMGLATMIAGYGLLSQEGGRYALTLMTLFAVHHTLAKTSLFLGYDLVDRGGKVNPVMLLVGLLLPCLALSGLPLTSGAMVKGAMKELTALGPHFWYTLGKYFLPVSSGGTTILMLHCVRLLKNRSHKAVKVERSLTAWLWLASVIGVATVPWLWPPLKNLGSHAIEPKAMLNSLWPVVLGTVLALAWFAAGSRLPGRYLTLPDFDYLARRLYEAFMDLLENLTNLLNRLRQEVETEPLRQKLSPLSAGFKSPGKWEKVLGRWSVVGLCYLIICLLLFGLLLTRQFFTGGL